MTRYPNYESDARHDESDEVWLRRTIARHMMIDHDDPINSESVEGVNYYIVDDSDLPDDKDFDAWEWRNNKVQVRIT
jgi:hypothetical protein|tara:strand:+ start:411 stop:641 length:231 start_codon:yes stop_codon:yes gene_type:complete